MIKKAFAVIKNNPVLVVMYLVYMVIMVVGMYIVLPNGVVQSNKPQIMMAQIGKLYLFLGVIGLIGMLFISGAGAMLSEAVINGKTSISSFLPGVKKFFGRIFRAALLLLGIVMGATIVLSIAVTIPIALFSASANQASAAGVTITSTIIVIGILFLSIFAVMPFLMLWLPALFIDDLKVAKALGVGAKAAKKNYGKLILIMLATFIPTAGYYVYLLIGSNLTEAYKSMGNIQGSPAYYVEMLVSAVLAIFILPMIFIIYNEYRLKNAPPVLESELPKEIEEENHD